MLFCCDLYFVLVIGMGIGTVILLLLTVFMTPLTEANHFTLAIFHTIKNIVHDDIG